MRRSVGLLVALAVVRGLLYAVIVPPWQAPDEPGHFEYVALVAELGHVPAREEVVETLTREINASVREHRFELFHRLIFIGQLSDQSPPVLVGPREAGYQKPLYYLLLAPLYKLVQTQPILVRYYLLVWVSIMMAAGVVFLAAQTARALFPDDPVLQLAIPALALFWPTQSYMAAAINNDNLATLLAALTMLTLVGLFKRGLTVPVVLSGLIIGLAAGEVKRTALFLIPLILLALCVFAVWRLAARLSPAGRRRFITLVGTVALSSLVMAVVLLAYPAGAQAVSAGLSRLPFESTSAIAWLITLAADGRLQDPEFLAWQQAQCFAIMRGAWAVFGWGSLWMARGWYWVVGGIAGVSVLGNLAWFVRGRENTGEMAAWQKLALAVFALALGLAGCVLLVNMVGAYFYNRVFAHARYLMTLLIPFSTFVALGLRALTPVRLRPLLVHTLLAALILFDVISLGLTIIPYYYG